MNVLFVCNQNKNRSKTAEELFKYGFNTKSAGLFNQNPVSKKELNWLRLSLLWEIFKEKKSERDFLIYIHGKELYR
jgi:predicted protein tyrosine phosphatase